jgi:predicted nucleic acid-binding protein
VIVLDSAAAVDYLLRLEPDVTWVRELLAAHEGDIHAPHLIDVEVTSVIRRFVLKRGATAHDGLQRVRALRDLGIRRYPHSQLLERVWELRRTVAPPDACFVALAEALDAPLVTTDRHLARARGPRIPVLCP